MGGGELYFQKVRSKSWELGAVQGLGRNALRKDRSEQRRPARPSPHRPSSCFGGPCSPAPLAAVEPDARRGGVASATVVPGFPRPPAPPSGRGRLRSGAGPQLPQGRAPGACRWVRASAKGWGRDTKEVLAPSGSRLRGASRSWGAFLLPGWCLFL